MARTKEEKEDVWEPSSQDVRELEDKLKDYKLERINGRLQDRIDLYCRDEGYIKFDELGNIIVLQPSNYRITRMTYDKMKYKQYYEQERFFKDNPEEESKYRSRLADMFKNLILKFSI